MRGKSFIKRELEKVPDFTEDELSILLSSGYSNPEEWITYRQLAEYLGTTIGSIRVMVHRGRLPESVDTGSKLVLLPREEALKMSMTKASAAKLMQREKRTLGQEPAPEEARLVGTRKKRTQATYLRILSDKVTPNDWLEIIERAIDDAKKGDHRARTWLSNYLIGTPIKRIAAAISDTSKRFTDDQRREAVLAMLLEDDDDEEGDDGNGYHDSDDEGVIEATYTYCEEAD